MMKALVKKTTASNGSKPVIKSNTTTSTIGEKSQKSNSVIMNGVNNILKSNNSTKTPPLSTTSVIKRQPASNKSVSLKK